MIRRHFLCAGAGLLAACATPAPSSSRLRLPRPLVSADRITRVLVGLRPYRASGFVVREASLGTKRVIHNYGHGGGGITLSWGTAELALEMGFAGTDRPYAVIGCGVIGLSTARLLQQRGASVTIYAQSLPPDTTSNIAGGHWAPYSVYKAAAATPDFLAQFHRAVRFSYRYFQHFVGPRYAIRWNRNYTVSDERVPFDTYQEALRDVLPEMALLGPGEHPFGRAYVQQAMAMMIEPTPYMRALIEDFRAAGGRIVVREFRDAGQVAALAEPIVFNCTGLGSRALFGDEELIPARGQLLLLLPQPEIDFNLFGNRCHIFPRTDGIILGGTFEEGNWSVEPDSATTAGILERNRQLVDRIL
jgi:D-amino-acid oxidase